MVDPSLGIVEPQAVRLQGDRLWKEALFTVVSLGLLLGGVVGTSLLLGRFVIQMPPEVLNADLSLYRRVLGLNYPPLTSFIFTFFNDPGLDYSVVIAACLGYLWWKRRRDMPIAVIAIGLTMIIGAWSISYTQVYGLRPRPFLLATNVTMNAEWREIWAAIPSFPSGHVRELTGLSLVLIYFWRRSAWFALPYLGFIAFSRVYIGAHFPTDVLGAMVIGTLSGSFSVVAVHQGRKTILGLARTEVVRSAYGYLFPPRTAEERGTVTMPARLIRSGLTFGALLAGTFALGYVIFIDNPRILADYLLNTNHSLSYPLVEHFDPNSAQLVYWFLADATKIIPALVVLALGYNAVKGWENLERTAVAVLVAFATAEITALVFSSHFGAPRPFATAQPAPPVAWQHHWSATATFPDYYLVQITALCLVLAKTWKQTRVPAYAYPFLVGLGLLYFGALWPLGALGSLMVGYWVGVFSLFLSGQVLALARGLRRHHAESAGNEETGDGSTANGLSVGMGGER